MSSGISNFDIKQNNEQSNEQNNINVNSSPIYTKMWFIVAVLAVIVIIISFLFGVFNDKKSKNTGPKGMSLGSDTKDPIVDKLVEEINSYNIV
jgi:hypothetical protein